MMTTTQATVRTDSDVLLDVRDLTVAFGEGTQEVRAVDRVSFTLGRGEVLGVVGESGSGKSVTALSVLRLLPSAARVSATSVQFEDVDLANASERSLRHVRGARIGFVFQDPFTSLNPVLTVGAQIAEGIRLHDRSVSRRAARERAVELLDEVRIPNARSRSVAYPHELSGGIRQRVAIAIAICNSPELLIADEPTTALDVTTQAEVLQLLRRAREAVGAAMILISHDLGLVGQQANRIAVMYRGRIMETGSTAQILREPRHPYTVALLRSRPSLGERRRLIPIAGSPPSPFDVLPGCPFAPRCDQSRGRERCTAEVPPLRLVGEHLVACHFAEEPPFVEPAAEVAAPPVFAAGGAPPLLEVEELTKKFNVSRGLFGRRRDVISAVDGLDFSIAPGRTLALVGESGCGKTTTARAVLRLIEPTSGRLTFDGEDIRAFAPETLRKFRARAQIVLQDPYRSLNPRKTAGETIAEPLRVHRQLRGNELDIAVIDALTSVGLHSQFRDRFPHELSGGQRQRVSIARSLGLNPALLVLDEPVSALDVSIQAQILNLLQDLQRERDIAFLLISHDLAVVRNLADDVAIMYFGQIVERAPVDEIFDNPVHPYTQALLAAVPDIDMLDAQPVVLGELPSAFAPPPGCRFHTRCPRAQDRCRIEAPEPRHLPSAQNHEFACHYPGPADRAVARVECALAARSVPDTGVSR